MTDNADERAAGRRGEVGQDKACDEGRDGEAATANRDILAARGALDPTMSSRYEWTKSGKERLSTSR
jgi:hypothetical protein